MLQDPFRLIAFRDLLPKGIKDYVDQNMDPSVTDTYEGLRAKVYPWALRKRSEAQKRPIGPANNVDPGLGLEGYAGDEAG